MAEAVTLDEVDACIDAAEDRGALFVGHWDWFVVREAQRDLKIRNNGGLHRFRYAPPTIAVSGCRPMNTQKGPPP